MNKTNFKNGIVASIGNGDRLVEDAKLMLECERFPTSYALAVLAQEEYAKALLLSLVDAGAIPWSAEIKHALHDHVCKQLVSVILEYLSPDIDEFLRRHDLSQIGKPRPIFPTDVLDAIQVICHERIPRKHERWWLDPSDRPLNQRVMAIADGCLDRQKQYAIYVHIGKTGEVCSRPSQVLVEDVKVEVGRSERIGNQLRPYDRVPGLPNDLDSEKLIALFRLLTGTLLPEDFNSYWWAR
ncbi:MAG: AbiV family abortive infection protein [Candidatus Neomarinimicrobiota bacterium]